MSDTTYTYAVAQVRALELSLLSAEDLEQMLMLPDQARCLQFLAEKGWGDGTQDPEQMLSYERKKAWQTVRSLLGEDSDALELLSYPDLFHNLKAAVRQLCAATPMEGIFLDDCAISGEQMLQWLQEKAYDAFPEPMRACAEEASQTLLHTGDGQLSDLIIDRAALEAISAAGQRAGDEMLHEYAQSIVAVANIRIAARCMKTGKSREFMLRAMAPCEGVSVDALCQTAQDGMQSFSDYLISAGYEGAAAALAQSASAFERWCDDCVIDTIEPQKRNPFTIGPLVAYLLGRENEIKTVRIVLTGKRNGLPVEQIRERVRKMYG